jgi:spermidine synthase
MLDLGRVIFQTQDLYGEIRVLDYLKKRILCFDVRHEQSASLKSDPAFLLYQYNQAMFLSLLYRRPRQILSLGLGAGSLVTALHKHCPQARITVVELRQSVIEIAHRYFSLPQDQRIQLHCADAEDFLAEHAGSYDLIFCDLYLAKGVSGVQMEPGFLENCADQLHTDGIFVINCWLDQLGKDEFMDTLSIYFSDIWCCLAETGNCLLFATNTPLEKSQANLRPKALKWSEQLGFSLLPYLDRMVRYSDLKGEDRSFIMAFQSLEFLKGAGDEV